jgi:hypothetical protein
MELTESPYEKALMNNVSYNNIQRETSFDLL